MKKKAILVTIYIAILLAGSIMGTLAYLTDQESAVNTFTVGKVDIVVDEADVNPDGEPIEGADRVNGNEYHLIPGKTYTKDPTLTVKSGSEESYVRMLVTVNKLKELDEIFAPDGVELLKIFGGYDAAKWIYIGESESETENTITYEFRYFETVDGTETKEDVALEALFTNFTLPGEITGEELNTINDLTITVMGHAIQKSGFDNADDAWAAFDKQINE